MPAMRAACYARFSSDLQRATSIDDQIVVARRYAAAQGWDVLDAHVYTDAALSGSSLDRPGIQAVLAAASTRPRPFDILLVDDSSRVARDLADAVRFMQQLKFAGVRVLYLSQGIDSASEQAETLVAVHGMVDGLYLREMASKIKRGLAGQLDRGFSTGSATFGYRTLQVTHSNGQAHRGRVQPLGFRVEVVPDEAATIVQIFELYASGLGVTAIVHHLNRARVPGPRGVRWKHGAVTRLLQNEKLLGRLIWGQRRFERRPGTRQKVARVVPRDQWRVLDRPDLRIISEALWSRVQARRAEVRAILPRTAPTLMRGRHAALFSKNLFSGFLRCGLCGGAVTAVNSGHGTPRYGCSSSWRNGVSTCDNRLTIRAKIADAQLLEGMKRELLAPATVTYIADAIASQVNRVLSEQPRLLREATRARDDVRERLKRLVTAIESGVPASSVSTAIHDREADLARLEATVAELAEPVHQRLAVMPGWVRQQLEDVAGLLSETPERAKLEFRHLGLSVAMHPIRDEGERHFYRAVGQAALPCLAGIRDLSVPTVDRLHHQSDGSRTWGFAVDLPANLFGPGRRRRA
jgi:DNA invertase Pin-like site-specific DNA recombinase